MEPGNTIQTQKITLEVGRDRIAPEDYSLERVIESVRRFNASVRIADLPVDLDAEQLDTEKVSAFIEGFPRLSRAELSLLASRTVRLNLPSTDLHASSAITAQTLRDGYGLEKDPNSANPHLAAVRLIASPSLTIASDRVSRAKSEIEHLGPDKGRQRRSVAMVLLSVSEQILEVNSDDQNAKNEIAIARKILAAEKAAGSGLGMP